MDKNAIKKYAVWARRELISRVTQKAGQYGISEKEIIPADAENIFGKVLTAAEKKQRQELISKINREGFTQVMEEAAYTWFNRFCALRFMEVNGYLPTHIRVFTNDAGEFKPQIITEAINLELDGLDMEKVYALKDANDDATLFKYLVIVQCNALSAVLPGIFQKINDYTELLFPDNLLRGGSSIEQMVTLIPEADWQDQVQIIGWLYQYYNTEPKDTVFANLKKNIKISKENIPAATQLFTPDWIVRYMVENSLGRIFIDFSVQSLVFSDEEERIAKEKELAQNMGWKYYLPEAAQTPEVRAQLNALKTKNYNLNTIKCIDPCCGSGHILVYMFDVLMQIYESFGYSQRDVATLIVQNNLYGLDIDERAAQLAYFSVMMKARQYDRRFFIRGVQPHVYAIAESNDISNGAVQYFCVGRNDLKAALQPVLTAMHDAKEYGSILTVPQVDFELLYKRFDEVIDDINFNKDEVLSNLLPVVQCAELLAQKYHTVCTNPPYMGGSGMSAKLSDYVKKYYPDSKSDLFAVFIEHCGQMTAKNGYQAMITQHAWMFLSSFEKLRGKLLQKDTVNMAHLGARAFEEIGGEVVQTTSFVLCNSHTQDYKGTYCRLIEPTTQQGKEDMFLAGQNRYTAQQDNFVKIPGSPVAYWVSAALFEDYNAPKLNEKGTARSGLQTGNNDLFLKYWYEVDNHKIAFHMRSKEEYLKTNKKWTPQIKGGEYRKWYGNFDYIVNWLNDGSDIRRCPGCRLNAMGNDEFFFREGVTWSHTTSSVYGARYLPYGHLFNVEAPTFFTYGISLYYVLGLLNSNVIQYCLDATNATMHYLVGNIMGLPAIESKDKEKDVEKLVDYNILTSQKDWNAYETSWDFKRNPLI